MSSLVPILGQYGWASFLSWSVGQALEAGEVVLGERTASLAILVASMCRDSSAGVVVQTGISLSRYRCHWLWCRIQATVV